MRFTHFFFLLNFLFFFSCKEQKLHLNKIESKQINITDTISEKIDVENFIKPYRDNIKKDLDTILSYSVNTYSKSDGDYNTAIGNFIADAIYEEANPIFKKRTGKDIDMVLLNHGSIRSILPKGNISKRTAYRLMPFENSLVVVALKGTQVDSLLFYLSQAKRAHPISKLKLSLDKDYKVVEAKIKGRDIDPNKMYFVATNNYLYNGGDHMNFFKTNDSLYVLNYKVRNALIDYFIKNDTIKPVIDDRFIQIN